jgi:hypothetical protein
MNKISVQSKMYFLNFVGEFWNVKPKYQNWHFGRIEIFKKEEKWPIDELRFSAPPSDDWEKFREKWDFEEIDDLDKFKKLLVKFQLLK